MYQINPDELFHKLKLLTFFLHQTRKGRFPLPPPDLSSSPKQVQLSILWSSGSLYSTTIPLASTVIVDKKQIVKIIAGENIFSNRGDSLS